jgi:hypothetical protein
MRFWLLTAGLVAALAVSVGAISYLCSRDPCVAAAGSGDTLQWLKAEFHLSEAQMERVVRMHDAYQEVCAGHCAEIRSSRDEMKRLRAAGAPETELAKAAGLIAEKDAHCRASTEAHVRAVAAVMGEIEGRRYLEAVLPRLSGYGHEAPPDLKTNSRETHGGHSHH